MFDQNGHLTDRAIASLVRGEALPELTRLEIAEHLAYCDLCLQRYTDALADIPLLTPEVPCADSVWRRIRQRSLRILTSRYATAAAAVVLALTLLWSDLPFPERTTLDRVSGTMSTVSTRIEHWSERWSTALRDLFEGTQTIFDGSNRPVSGGKINERT